MFPVLKSVCAAVVALSVAADQSHGADLNEFLKLAASDAAAGDNFGGSVALSRGYRVIGASRVDSFGENSGAVYVEPRSSVGGQVATKLTASDLAAGDRFGGRVDLWRDYMIVGAQFDDDDDRGADSGSAYIYKLDGTEWVEQVKLAASDGAANELFGRVVSIDGERAIVGAPGRDEVLGEPGAAYIFRREGAEWIEEAKLVASDGVGDELFGYSVSIWGDYAIVGAEDDSDHGPNSGSAYVFHRQGESWVEQAKLYSSDPSSFNRFGGSVAIEGEFAVVGERFGDVGVPNSGSVHVFHRSGDSWNLDVSLVGSDTGPDLDYFGGDVAMDSGSVVVGARNKDDGKGAAYVFQRQDDDWTEIAKLTASDGQGGDGFGVDVAIFDTTVLVGAFRNNSFGLTDSGAAYLFTIPAPPTLVLFANPSISLINPTTMEMSWSAEAGKQYTLYCSTDLESWIPLGDPHEGVDGMITVQSNISDSTQKFYRVEEIEGTGLDMTRFGFDTVGNKWTYAAERKPSWESTQRFVLETVIAQRTVFADENVVEWRSMRDGTWFESIYILDDFSDGIYDVGFDAQANLGAPEIFSPPLARVLAEFTPGETIEPPLQGVDLLQITISYDESPVVVEAGTFENTIKVVHESESNFFGIRTSDVTTSWYALDVGLVKFLSLWEQVDVASGAGIELEDSLELQSYELK